MIRKQRCELGRKNIETAFPRMFILGALLFLEKGQIPEKACARVAEFIHDSGTEAEAGGHDREAGGQRKKPP
jgi:hypothetical protein